MFGLLIGTLGVIAEIIRSIELKRAFEARLTFVAFETAAESGSDFDCGTDFIDAAPRWSSRITTKR